MESEVPVFERLTAKSPFALVVKAALEEARRRGDRRLGTEHLLLGLLQDPGSAPAKALGVDLRAARTALDDLDRRALAAVGIDVTGLPTAPVPSRKRPGLSLSMLTSSARSAIDHAVKATRTGTRDTAPDHLLLALLACESPDPAAELMTALDIDRPLVRARIDLPEP
jgi:ATP-dependent Clp protease ATP-binding subunit ClpA